MKYHLYTFHILLWILYILSIKSEICPKSCSGHGSCDKYTKQCICDSPYNITSDCSKSMLVNSTV